MSTTHATGADASQSSGDTLVLRRLRQRPAAPGRRPPERGAEAFSPMASTLIYGSQDAVLTDPGMTRTRRGALGDWVEAHGRNLTDIFVTHGHGDHWFAAGLLAERFEARVVASTGTIAQMRGSVASRPLLWDKVYSGIPDAGHRRRRARQPLHARGPRPRDRRGRPHRQRRHHRPARPRPRPRRRRRRDLQRRPHVPRPERDPRRLRHVARRDRQDRGARAPAHRLRPPEQGARRRRRADRSRRPGSTSTTPRSSCGRRTPRVDFFNAKIERYPDHLGRFVLWAGTRALYGARENPDGDIAKILLGSWL